MARGKTKANGFAWNSHTKECMGIENAIGIGKKGSFWRLVSEPVIFSMKIPCLKPEFLLHISSIFDRF